MRVTTPLNERIIFILFIILIMFWSLFFYFDFKNQSKEEVIKSLTGNWNIYFKEKPENEFFIDSKKIFIDILDNVNEDETDRYFKKNEVKPAGVHLLKFYLAGILVLEVCGFDGLEISSCIVLGNFDLDDNKEILLVYYKDISGSVNDFTVVDFVDNQIILTNIGENNTIGKLIKQYFKSTNFSGFREITFSSLFLYIAVIDSVITFIFILLTGITIIKNRKLK